MPNLEKRDFTKLLKNYKLYLKKLGYNILYDGSKPEDNSGLMLLMEKSNQDKDSEPKYIFYNVFEGAPLSIEGFEKTVLNEKQEAVFLDGIEKRIAGCTISKTDAVFGLLLTGKYKIQDIYKNNDLVLNPARIKELMHWVNFNGGRNPVVQTKRTK